MNQNWKKTLVFNSCTIREVLTVIDGEALRVALVVDQDNTLLGVITDGDVRRGLLRGISLDESVSSIMATDPTVSSSGASREQLMSMMEEKDLLVIPLVDDGVLVGLETLHHVLERPKYDNPVFLMAGGFGTRLRPLTDNCPKPMLNVGGKPILETVIRNFCKAGFTNFYISTHYMPEVIENYFGDGTAFGVNIKYVYEDAPLGTGGALGLLPDDLPSLPLIIMNGDVLTKVDFQRLLEFHNENDAAATMCVREYEYQVPFGVVSGDGINITSMVEKPVHSFFVNAGIYVVSPDVVQAVALNQKIDMPDLLEQQIKGAKKVLMFPIHEYWLDIGRMDDFNKAQVDFHALGLD